MRRRKMVDAALQDRVQQPILERDHLRAESQGEEIVLAREHANAAAAVCGKLPRSQPGLELDGVGLRRGDGRHDKVPSQPSVSSLAKDRRTRRAGSALQGSGCEMHIEMQCVEEGNSLRDSRFGRRSLAGMRTIAARTFTNASLRGGSRKTRPALAGYQDGAPRENSGLLIESLCVDAHSNPGCAAPELSNWLCDRGYHLVALDKGGQKGGVQKTKPVCTYLLKMRTITPPRLCGAWWRSECPSHRAAPRPAWPRWSAAAPPKRGSARAATPPPASRPVPARRPSCPRPRAAAAVACSPSTRPLASARRSAHRRAHWRSRRVSARARWRAWSWPRARAAAQHGRGSSSGEIGCDV